MVDNPRPLGAYLPFILYFEGVFVMCYDVSGNRLQLSQRTTFVPGILFAFSITGRDETSRRRHCSKSKHSPENCPWMLEVPEMQIAAGCQLNIPAGVDLLLIGFMLVLFLSICKLPERS